MGGMAAARMADEIGHVGVWARLARVALRVGSAMVEGLLVAGVVALALGVSVATFGCGAFILCGLAAGFIGGATGWSDYKEKKIQEMTEDIGDLEITGTLGIKGAARVLINKRQAMRAVLDAAVCGKHASLNPNRIAEGSDSVFIETGPAARKGDKMECAAQIATGSDTVLIGGNKTQYLEIADDKMWWETGAELGLALLGRGSLPGKLGCLALGAAVGMAGDLLGKGFRSVIGYPVNPATGGKVLDGNQDTDFTLPGLLPIQWKRFYSSHDHRDHTWHGKGWSTPYEVELHVFEPEGGKPGGLTYVNPQGRCIDMPWLEPGTMFFNTAEGFTLGCTHGGAYEVVDMDLLRYQFGAPVSGFAGPGGASVLRLQRLRNRTGQWIRLSYREDADQRLDKITDPLGRIIRVQYATGALSSHSRRVQGLMLERGAVGETTGLLAQYGYDAAGQLNEVRWRDGRTARRFQYEHGLMVAHSDAANFTCFYAWQAPEAADGPVSQGLAPNSIWATPTGRDRRVVRHWTSDGEQYDIAYQVGQTLGAASTPAAPDLAGSVAGQTWATDKLGRTEHWRWNGLYNLCSYTNAMEHTWVLTWSASRELLSATLPGGQTWLWQYDDNGLPILETDPLGRSTRTLWDTNWFEPLSVSLPDDSKWGYEYDARGLCTSVTAPDGATNHYAWDNHGLLVQVTDANGGQKRLEHDPRSLVTAYTDCSGQTTRYAYDGIGHLQRVTDALGQATLLGHGVTGELLTLTLADGATQSWRYDAAGRPIAHTNAQPRTRNWTYTQRGQLKSQIDEEQRGIALAYDTAQRLSTLVNENGQHFGFEYDAADRMVEETRVGGQRVTVEYDANGWPVAVNHHPVASDISADLTVGEILRTDLVRDAVGRLLEKRCGRHHYQYKYDTLDQLTQAKKLALQPDGSLKPLHTSAFVYDKAGNLIEETATDETTSQSHTLRHSHDALGNRTQTQLPTLPGQLHLKRALNYLHYGSGHLHQINYSQRDTRSPDALAVHQLISDIERDALHRETQRSQGHIATRYALDPLGRRQGMWSQSTSVRTQPFRASDPDWQRAVLSAGTPDQGAFDGLTKAYAYDKVGELRQSRHSLRGDTGHRYDATGRIEQSMRQPLPGARGHTAAAYGETFQYDPAGNILDNKSQAALASRTQHHQEGYVRDNLVRVFEDKRYFYDGHGRLVQKLSGRHTAQAFQWDEESRLIQVTTTRRPGTEHQTTQISRFDYDAIGRRVAKHDTFGTTVFIWEGMRLIEERRGSAIISYVYETGSYVPLARLDADGDKTDQGGLGKSGDALHQWANTETIAASASQESAKSQEDPKFSDTGSDDETRYWAALEATAQQQVRAVGTNDPDAKLCDIYYFHTDQVGLPEELSNAHGQLVWQAQYKTWGSTVEEQWERRHLHGAKVQAQVEGDTLDGENCHQNLRFQGQYLDRDTGLHYNTFRYYDADIGRFISPDPIGLVGGVNLGLYAPNPFSYSDPLGLEKYIIIGEGQGAVEVYAKNMRSNPAHANHEFRTIKKDWGGVIEKSGAKSAPMGSFEWEKRAVQGNIDWIKDRHAEGYKFIDIGNDASSNRSAFYAAEKQALAEVGARPMRGNSAAIAAARAAAPSSNRPKSKMGC